MITEGVSWRCKSCSRAANSERGRLLVGDKNPFFGKRHSESTGKQMRASSRVRWDNTPEEERARIGSQIRTMAFEKYGGNPMVNPEVRKSYLKGIAEFWADPEAVAAKAAKIKATCIAKYGRETYLHSEDYMEHHHSFKFKAEKEMVEFFASLGFIAKKRRIEGVELDLYIEELGLAVEHNGVYYHSELYRPNDYHIKKAEFCSEKGIKLIQVFDYEWQKKKPQVKDFLLAQTGNCKKVAARKCKIVFLDKVEASIFLNKNHIQGAVASANLFLGLRYEDRLVAVAAFGKHHRQSISSRTVMKRFVSEQGIVVVGGLGRLSRAASETLKVDIYSWCDRRWSSGKSYESAGWSFDGVIAPQYFYIKNGRYYCSKQARQKNKVGTPAGMTEHEHAIADKLFRVYDCGKFRMKYSYVAKGS